MPSLIAEQIALQIAQGKTTFDNVPNGMKKDVAFAMAVMGLAPRLRDVDLDQK